MLTYYRAPVISPGLPFACRQPRPHPAAAHARPPVARWWLHQFRSHMHASIRSRAQICMMSGSRTRGRPRSRFARVQWPAAVPVPLASLWGKPACPANECASRWLPAPLQCRSSLGQVAMTPLRHTYIKSYNILPPSLKESIPRIRVSQTF